MKARLLHTLAQVARGPQAQRWPATKSVWLLPLTLALLLFAAGCRWGFPDGARLAGRPNRPVGEQQGTRQSQVEASFAPGWAEQATSTAQRADLVLFDQLHWGLLTARTRLGRMPATLDDVQAAQVLLVARRGPDGQALPYIAGPQKRGGQPATQGVLLDWTSLGLRWMQVGAGVSYQHWNELAFHDLEQAWDSSQRLQGLGRVPAASSVEMQCDLLARIHSRAMFVFATSRRELPTSYDQLLEYVGLVPLGQGLPSATALPQAHLRLEVCPGLQRVRWVLVQPGIGSRIFRRQQFGPDYSALPGGKLTLYPSRMAWEAQDDAGDWSVLGYFRVY